MTAFSPALDTLRPFQLENSQLRGRFVRLGDTIDRVLCAHDYPAPVLDQLGELLVLAGALAGGLKFEGTFSLQIRGDGPVSLMVADVSNSGRMRGYASFDEKAVAALPETDLKSLTGKGLLALTVDQAATGGETYQGIVEVDPRGLQHSMLGYFHKSEQVPTGIRAAITRDEATGRWIGGAIVIQSMPELGSESPGERAEDWRRTMLLLQSVSEKELTDPGLPLDLLLFRLFHEEGVRIFDVLDLAFGCSCDEERVERVLRQFTPAELDEMKTDDGDVVVTCQFCSRAYRFDDVQIKNLLAERTH